MIGAHVDPALQDKIRRGEYIDFATLLPRDRNSFGSEEQRMELVNRGGQSFFVPSDKDQSLISSFGKWEQAFRIFMNVYTKQYPEKASELIQYNHIIFTASTSYV